MREREEWVTEREVVKMKGERDVERWRERTREERKKGGKEGHACIWWFYKYLHTFAHGGWLFHAG